MKRIAVLLTVYNRKEKTIKCLYNLEKQQLPEYVVLDVFIVDGGSTDGTVTSVKKQFPYVHIKTVEGVFWNRGMIAAWNMAEEYGCESGQYDYYLWLNDDTFIYEDCIQSLLDVCSQYDNKIITVGSTVDTKLVAI